MAQLKPVRIPQFQGGLDKSDKTIIKDNQLAVATNVFYNQDRNLQTRFGQANFGNIIPDAVLSISDTDSTASPDTWAVADDAVNATANTSTQQRGSGAINFDVTVATSGNDYATVTAAIASAKDISTTKGSLRFWFKIPSGGLTDLTNLVVRFGSDSSNYYEWTVLASDLAEGQNFLILNYADATTTGTPVDTAMDYLFFRLNYANTYTDKTDFEICALYSYSGAATLPMMSLFYFKATDTSATRYLLTNVGTSMFLYEENTGDWEAIKTGLTSGSRFSFTAYKNVIYATNGVDNYMSFDGTSVSEHTGANTYKGKYLLLANDIGYIAGDPTVPTTLGYTGGTPTNLQTFPNALVVDEDDSSGPITGLINLGPIVFVMKKKKIYKVNVAAPSREQIDYSEGFLSHRGLVRVENEVFGINNSGIYTLAQREATIGSVRADAVSDDIKQIIDDISDKELVSAIYVEKLKNCYFFVDTTSNGVPDTALVFSVLTKKWTTYNNMAFNQAVLYEDSLGNERFIGANAVSGQARELETGLVDIESEINVTIDTKAFDFNQPETYKTYEMVEVFGFIEASSQMTVNILVDDENRSGDILVRGDNYDTEISGFSLAQNPLASVPLAGSAELETITFYPFKLRIPMYATGSNIQIRLLNNTLNSQWILTKASIYPYPQPVDIYPNEFIA